MDGWDALARAHAEGQALTHAEAAPLALPPTDDRVRARAREELGREPSSEEYFMVAAGRPASDATRQRGE